MDDYRITIRVRNARILKAMEAKGIRSIYQLSKQADIGYSCLLGLVNITMAPILSDGTYRVGVMSLCEFLGKTPRQLFPEQHRYDAMVNNKREFDMSLEQIGNIIDTVPSSETLIEHKEDLGRFADLIDKLTIRETQVIKGLYGIDGTPVINQKQLATELGITPARIGQINTRALQKLKTKPIARDLLPYY